MWIDRSFKVSLGTLRGVTIKVHASLVLIIASLAFWQASKDAGVVDFLLVLFFCAGFIFLYSFLLVVFARRFKLLVSNLTVKALGHTIFFSERPDQKNEFKFELCLAAFLIVLTAIFGVCGQLNFFQDGSYYRTAFKNMCDCGLFLSTFNVLPAMPLAGGRLLKVFLQQRDVKRLHVYVMRCGILVSSALAFILFTSSPTWLLWVPLWIAASAFAEYSLGMTADMARLITVRETMIPLSRLTTLPHRLSIQDGAKRAITTSQEFFPIIGSDTVLGVVERNTLIHNVPILDSDEGSFVLSLALKNIPQIDIRSSLTTAMEELEKSGLGVVSVIEDAKCVGFIRDQQILDAVMLAEAGRLSALIDEP